MVEHEVRSSGGPSLRRAERGQTGSQARSQESCGAALVLGEGGAARPERRSDSVGRDPGRPDPVRPLPGPHPPDRCGDGEFAERPLLLDGVLACDRVTHELRQRDLGSQGRGKGRLAQRRFTGRQHASRQACRSAPFGRPQIDLQVSYLGIERRHLSARDGGALGGRERDRSEWCRSHRRWRGDDRRRAHDERQELRIGVDDTRVASQDVDHGRTATEVAAGLDVGQGRRHVALDLVVVGGEARAARSRRIVARPVFGPALVEGEPGPRSEAGRVVAQVSMGDDIAEEVAQVAVVAMTDDVPELVPGDAVVTAAGVAHWEPAGPHDRGVGGEWHAGGDRVGVDHQSAGRCVDARQRAEILVGQVEPTPNGALV